jgi:2-desacetyl-2-hydroxyethyl bacteriochlorophyllide A dehydrogenase
LPIYAYFAPLRDEELMKAVVKMRWEPKAMEFKEVPSPEVGHDDVLMKVEFAGICGSDVEIYDATYPIPMITTPRIIGHEFSGTVVNAGRNVTGFKVGDRVTSETGLLCERCWYCNMGRYNLCVERKALGFKIEGTFAEYTKMVYTNLHKIPENVSFEEAAIAEPISVAVNAVLEKGDVTARDRVCVIGPGPIGLLVSEVARAAGAGEIIVAGLTVDSKRLDAAKKLGFRNVVDVQKQNLEDEVRSLTEDYGVDVAFETAGSPEALQQAIAVTRKGGKIVILGLPRRPIDNLNIANLVYNEKTIEGSFSHIPKNWKTTIHLLDSHKIHVKPIISHILPLDRFEEGLQLVKNKSGLKVLLKP